MATTKFSARDTSISVEVSGFTATPQVERLWRELEERANPSFFLSWTWIGAWLETSGLAPAIIMARSADRLVGLGLLNPARRQRMGFRWTCLSLHESGRREHDCIMMEDNGFLVERGLEANVTRVCLRYLIDAVPDWRELRLGGVSEAISRIVDELGLPIHLEAKRPAPFVEIAAIPRESELAALSRNARQQIRRSLRLYEQRGTVSLQRSTCADEALERFAEMEDLHQRYWTAKGKSGAFANPFFGRFHRTLLVRGFPLGQVDVLRVAAGSSIVGFLHIFFHGGDAYAYQSGFNYESDPRLKPGLVSHILALRHCREMSMRRYRLLAGDSRYKRTLSTGAYFLDWLSLRRPTPIFRLERLARRIARREP